MSEQQNNKIEEKVITKLFPRPNGPLVVTGERLDLIDENGKVIKSAERFSICRCGHSASQPMCDGSHNRIGFTG